jgi:F-type H+-transporting ATPase subunit gamma
MAALKSIKLKIRSIEKTRKVTKAMEAVSAVKMRRSQQKALSGRAYARAAVSILARISGARELAQHPLTRGAEKLPLEASLLSPAVPRGSFSALYIVITSDKGLAGALNSAVLRAVWSEMKGNTNAKVIAVGRKANDFFTVRGVNVVEYHPNTDQISSELIRELVDTAAAQFTSGEVDIVKIAYQNFFSTFEQRPTIRTIFPLTLGELSQVVGDIVPARGVFAQTTSDIKSSATYTIEPSEGEVLDVIVPKLASIFVYHALLETQASEHSARMVAMKSASDKAKELTHGLTIKFNKARQAAITREVSEITGGMEAMSG